MKYAKGQILRAKKDAAHYWKAGDDVAVDFAFEKGIIVITKDGQCVSVIAEVIEDYLELLTSQWNVCASTEESELNGIVGVGDGTSGVWISDCLVIHPREQDEAKLLLEPGRKPVFYKMAILPRATYEAMQKRADKKAIALDKREDKTAQSEDPTVEAMKNIADVMAASRQASWNLQAEVYRIKAEKEDKRLDELIKVIIENKDLPEYALREVVKAQQKKSGLRKEVEVNE